MEKCRNARAGGNRRFPRKPADQRHCPTRFPHAKIRERTPVNRTRYAFVGWERRVRISAGIKRARETGDPRENPLTSGIVGAIPTCENLGLSLLLPEYSSAACKEMLTDETPEKLVVQSYDDASVMSGKNTGVQARVKEIDKNAHFVHCYAHQLNLIIERCATQNKRESLKIKSARGPAAHDPADFSTPSETHHVMLWERKGRGQRQTVGKRT
ncbi:hypothetical protein PR048_018242 [Dryococelus australis]|uniref:DUF4371 domain-containing protein n=1 Tax=Dryococelus australis TaxID=614101 RepID=A0ABQ9HBV5_9NEOP|nr:hypothetical protein PR048_018242 [Dryococelus australis]